MQYTEGHPQVPIGLEGFNLSLLGLNIKMGRLVEIDFIAIDGLPLKNLKSLIYYVISIHSRPHSRQRSFW